MPKLQSSYKISTTILFTFSFLIGIVAVSILIFQYFSAKDLAYKAIQNNVKHISDNTFKQVNNFNTFSQSQIAILELSSGIHQYPKKNIQHPLLKKFVASIMDKKYIYALYTGFENGNFYELINLNIDQKLRKKYKASDEERWLVVKIYKENNQRIQVEEFLDKELKILRTTQKLAKYDPTKRPWYKKALHEKDMIKTAPYTFSNLGSMGVTFSKQLDNSANVLSVDISLKTLQMFLKNQEVYQGSKLFIFNQKEQKVIATNGLHSKEDKIFKEKLNYLINQNTNNIKINEITYFLSVVNLHSKFGEDEYLITLIPEHEIMKPYNEKIILTLYINLFLMVLVLPMVWYTGKIIINPIKNLEIENEKIKNRNFKAVKQIKSPIKEINELSESIVSMSHSIQKYEDAQKLLMDSFIEIIASAIDKKSEYTGGHGKRVPVITMMLAQEASDIKTGIFKDFELKDEEQIRELKIAALLHDCGKITTPEYVVDKSTKLETIYNRIHEIRTRFEVIYRDKEIEYYKNIQLNPEKKEELKIILQEEQNSLIEDFEFIAQCNIGAEFMADEKIEKIKEIATRTWYKQFDDTLGLSQEEANRITHKETSNKENLLSDKYNHIIKRTSYFQEEYEADGFKGTVPLDLYNLGEVYNLTIKKGTLTSEERFKINEHIIMTIKMLGQLPFPEQLKKVPEYAGAHHETLIGTGYPKQLTKKDMSVPARIMAIADVFEALTASDRPYKEAKKLSESIKILSFMAKDQHIDQDLFELFLQSGVYKEYAKEFLKEEQIDEVDIEKYIS